MALPATIVSSATTTWSDHKNQSHGGAQRVTFYTDNSDDGTFYNLGDTSSHVAIVAGYSGQAGHKLIRVRCYLQRVGSPTGNVLVEAREFDSNADTINLGMAPWGVSKSFPVSSIPTSGKNEIVFTFPVPVSLPSSDSTSFAIVLTVSVQGDSSNYVKVYKGVNGDRGFSHAYGAGNTTWTNTTGTGISLSKVVEISKSGARVLTVDKTNSVLVPQVTNDNSGSSWSAETTASIVTTATLKSVNGQVGIHDLGASYIAHPRASANLGIYKRTEATGPSLDPSTAVSFSTFGTNVSGTAPIFGGRRANGQSVLVAQKATETVMGAPRRRIGLAFHNGTSWSSVFDVVGSANTPNATLPGDAADHELRWAALDPDGAFHIIYSKSDTSTLQYRKFKADNTFTTINTLNGAVASATANYPVGQGTFLYKSPDWYIAVPYVDNTSNTLKEARSKTSNSETSTNWTVTQIVSVSAEVSGSNPALLLADNAQGGKVFCLRVVPTTKGLRMTHDGGNSTYIPEVDWRGATQVVGGISGFYVEDGLAFVYLEEGTTPDELRYDRL